MKDCGLRMEPYEAMKLLSLLSSIATWSSHCLRSIVGDVEIRSELDDGVVIETMFMVFFLESEST